MGRRRTPGLIKLGEIWHIDKQIRGRRVCESTGTGNLEEAEDISHGASRRCVRRGSTE